MQGKSHIGFAIAGSIAINNGLYIVLPRTLPGVFDNIVHAIGKPWSFAQMGHLWETQQLLNSNNINTLGHKLTFFIILVLCARLPDRLERRGKAETRMLNMEATLPVKHRGFTHSCFLVILLVLFFVAISYFLGSYFQHHQLQVSAGVSDFFAKEAFAVFLGILLAFVLHIIADSMTKQGVKVMWPDETHYGLLPRSLRFPNDTWPEYIILWSIIFVIGGLIFQGIFGI